MTNMQSNATDVGIWTLILSPIFTDIARGWLVGTFIALVALFMRFKEWKEVKRSNDLKELELKGR